MSAIEQECLDVIWDCLIDAEIEPTVALTKLWAPVIPREIRLLAEQWGWNDTEVREQLTVFIKTTRNIEGKPHG